MRSLALFTILAALGVASPTPTARWEGEDSRPTCVVEHANGGDDTPNVHDAVAKCSSDAVIHFKAGVD